MWFVYWRFSGSSSFLNRTNYLHLYSSLYISIPWWSAQNVSQSGKLNACFFFSGSMQLFRQVRAALRPDFPGAISCLWRAHYHGVSRAVMDRERGGCAAQQSNAVLAVACSCLGGHLKCTNRLTVGMLECSAIPG